MHAGLDSRMTMILLPPVADNDEDEDPSKMQAGAGNVFDMILHCVRIFAASVALGRAGAAGGLQPVL